MSRTILVADDSAAIQKRASAILAGEGLEVFTVSNGVAAIKKLPSLKPLLVLADVSMPGKDGYEVCEYVKAAAELAHIPVLLLVSDLEPYDEQRGARVRANGVVQKPFEPETLISEVNRFVAQAEAALAEAQVADTAINISAPPASEFGVDIPPAEEELEPAPQNQGLDWGALPEGSAFGDVAPYEPPAAPPEPALAAETLPEVQYPAEPEVPVAMDVPAVEALSDPFPSYEAFRAEPAPAEPVFIEEAAPAVSETAQAEGPAMTMMFHAPVEIAEPVLQDELAPAPPVEETPVTATEPELEVAAVAAEPDAEPVPVAELETAPVVEEPPPPAVEETAASLVGSASPVEITAPEWAEVPPPAVELQPAEAAGGPVVSAPILNDEWIFWIVRSAVVKMSPPALSNEAIEEVARKLTDEITAELDSYNQQG